jgi:hypothetical protein
MKPEAAERAAEIEPHDAEQRAITEAALRESGPEYVVTVQHVDGGDPPWQAFRCGHPISFAGLFIYGGQTRDEAVEAARRIASKWDWTVDA